MFNEIGLVRRHIKRDHLNKSSPWQKYKRADIIEIAEEMSLFAELKTLTEYVHEKSVEVVDAGMTDLRAQVQLKLSTQLE